MANYKLQVERDVEELERRVDRCETAIKTMADWLVQAQTGFGAKDAEGIHSILRGEYVKVGQDEQSGTDDTDEEGGISVEMKRDQRGTDIGTPSGTSDKDVGM